MCVSVVAEVREVENNILETSRKLWLSKSIQRDPVEGRGQCSGIFMKAIIPA